jgi:ribosomal protein L44E
LIDDPYIIVLPGVNNELPLIKRFASQSNGIYLKISNDIALQTCKEYNVLLLIDVKKKQMLLGESRKNDRKQSRFKTQSRMVVESIDDVSGPKMVNLKLRVWGCLKYTI